MLQDILAAAPDIKVIATSREKLNIFGETVFNFSGFRIDEWLSLEDAVKSSAVRLFIQSSERSVTQFQIEERDLVHIAEIIRTVQGMPLGIILAAAWVDVLSIQEIAEEISQSLDFLETEAAGVPDRHRSIRAVFDYSWQLLDENRVLKTVRVHTLI